MIRLAMIVAIAATAAGCARNATQGMSYVGLSDVEAAEMDSDSANGSIDNAPSLSARHVQSNKVLGAMAFQKVTGRTVDPGRLSGAD